MRRLLVLFLIFATALVPAACRKQPEGATRVIVIGDRPEVSDPAKGRLSPPDAVLLTNVAQGLVRFDASGNIVGGLAERWNVSDDGLSYIFRIASTTWPNGQKVTADQVAKILKREIGPRSRNELKDTLGAVQDIVAMTDRVIEIQLIAPRPNLLALLAQPDFAIVQRGMGTGPFSVKAIEKGASELRLTRNVLTADEEQTSREEVLLSGAKVENAVRSFAGGNADLVLGGTFADLPVAQRTKLPRDSLQFDPASGLFGLVPLHSNNHFDDPAVRQMLSQALDRDSIVTALGVPGLAPRATLLEAGLDQLPPPAAPAWLAIPLANRIAALKAQADRAFGKDPKPAIRIWMSEGPGSDLLLAALGRSWGALGLTVERATGPDDADFALVDEVAPSESAAWFVRHFRCDVAAICDADTDKLMDSAREAPNAQQRSALLQQAAARIDDLQLFIPITAPVRWSLVGRRVQGFAGNRFGVHTLTDLQQKPGNGS